MWGKRRTLNCRHAAGVEFTQKYISEPQMVCSLCIIAVELNKVTLYFLGLPFFFPQCVVSLWCAHTGWRQCDEVQSSGQRKIICSTEKHFSREAWIISRLALSPVICLHCYVQERHSQTWWPPSAKAALTPTLPSALASPRCGRLHHRPGQSAMWFRRTLRARAKWRTEQGSGSVVGVFIYSHCLRMINPVDRLDLWQKASQESPLIWRILSLKDVFYKYCFTIYFVVRPTSAQRVTLDYFCEVKEESGGKWPSKWNRNIQLQTPTSWSPTTYSAVYVQA